MNEESIRSLVERLAQDHRRLDGLFGMFLAAAAGGNVEEARRAIEVFDGELRQHMALEEEHLLPEPAGDKLTPPEVESVHKQLFRELRLEHVQIREVSGMIQRLLAEKGDLGRALALAGNLARRLDAHTAREERELFASKS